MGAVGTLIIGLVLLGLASDRFVVGAARVASALRVPAVVVGAVVVGFGTSLPELLVSVLAAGGGDVALATGNVVGSNLANVTLVLACAALVVPVTVDSGTIRREGLLSAASVCLFGAAVLVGLSKASGALLLVALAGAMALILRAALHARSSEEEPLEHEVVELEGTREPRFGTAIVLAAAGLVGTLAGAQLVVLGALDLAATIGLSEGFVGLTVVAVGTSLPELVTAIQAARRGEDELIVGNVLGSNLFNSLAVGGAIALTGPGLPAGERLPAAVGLMVAASAVVGAVLVWRRGVGRPLAVALLVAYGVTVSLMAT